LETQGQPPVFLNQRINKNAFPRNIPEKAFIKSFIAKQANPPESLSAQAGPFPDKSIRGQVFKGGTGGINFCKKGIIVELS